MKGSKALVTGSTAGIGRAIALAAAEAGAHVIVSGRDIERGAQVVIDIKAKGGSAEFIAADLSAEDGARRLAKDVTDTAGALDVLVNNAGVYSFAPSDLLPMDAFDQMMFVNVRAMFELTRALAPAMAKRGSGSIVNITSAAAHVGVIGSAAYGASKAAVDSLTKTWAREYGESGVRVNAVSPGPTHTLGTSIFADGVDATAALSPLGRAGQPEDIAGAVLFLASEQARLINGASIHLDGGFAVTR